jgi:hypothetical protein
MSEDEELIIVYSGSQISAGFLKGLLEDAGITVFLWDEHISAINPLSAIDPLSVIDPLPFSFNNLVYPVRVVIAKRDLYKAEPIIEEFLKIKPIK